MMPGSNKGSSAYEPRADELIPLNKAADLSGLSKSYLRLLVSGGEIWGIKVGRNWVTTEKAVREFLVRERKRGPKPKIKLD